MGYDEGQPHEAKLSHELVGGTVAISGYILLVYDAAHGVYPFHVVVPCKDSHSHLTNKLRISLHM